MEHIIQKLENLKELHPKIEKLLEDLKNRNHIWHWAIRYNTLNNHVIFIGDALIFEVPYSSVKNNQTPIPQQLTQIIDSEEFKLELLDQTLNAIRQILEEVKKTIEAKDHDEDEDDC
jgi:hypothetical protein